MRVALVYPNIGQKGDSLFVDGARMEPLGLAVLAGLTPADIELFLIDDRIEAIRYDRPYDLVAITVQIFTARRSYQIADAFRARGVPVVLGGVHVTLAPEEAAGHADAIVVGDAELSWPQLIDDARRSDLQPRYEQPPAACPQIDTLPRRDLYRSKAYLPVSLLQFSRGCPNRCEFCASSVYFDRRHYVRDIGEVVREVKSQPRRQLFFVDDNIVADKEAAKELFRALIPLKKHWVSQASLDMLDDAELMDLMVKSGCLGHVIGFESIGAEGIAAMRKSSNAGYIGDGYAQAVAELRRYGLQTWAAFTLGHDSDTLESIAETCAFALRSKFTFAAFNILYPYPGTEFYARLAAEDRLLYDGQWWLHPDYRFNHATFQPRNMTADQLTAAAFDCRRAFNSPSSILRRAFEPRTNMRSPYRLLTYAAYNPLFRREVYNKQGISFGYASEAGGNVDKT
ncbi:MAG: B12-binding domain-containing radical SAM protein [Coriobacteriia bacterium]|nr:B12-binding domain-containing radical SAM protein [Coriobacteriia bacterium]